MRLACLFLLLPFAGCLDDDATRNSLQEGAAVAFEATYGGGEATLALRLSGPETIADPFLTPVEAYRLEISWGHPDWMALYAGPYNTTAYLDGAFRIIRIDDPCSSHTARCASEEDGPLMHLDWHHAGFLAPLGVGWPQENGEATLAGNLLDISIEKRGERYGLAAETPVPQTWWSDARNTFAWDANGVPTKVEWFDSSDNNSRNSLLLERKAVRVGSVLPEVPTQPLVTQVRQQVDVSYRAFMGEEEEAFGMGITFADAMDEFDARGAEAGTDACLLFFAAFWGGGSRSNGVPLLFDSDVIAFQFAYADEDSQRQYELRYASDGTTALTADIESTWWEEGGRPRGIGGTCGDRLEVRHLLTPAQHLRDLWQLPLHASGYPCNIMSWTDYLSSDSPDRPLAAGHVFWSMLFPGIESGTPWDAHTTRASAARDASTGSWVEMFVPLEDAAALDAGIHDLPPRPLPEPTLADNFDTYRCVPSQGAA